MALYANDGSINVTIVTGSTPTGIYAPDGSLNIILSDQLVNRGLYHPCGAMLVTPAFEGGARSPLPAYAPNGSRYISLPPFVALEGAMRVTILSGTFATIPLSGNVPSLELNFGLNYGKVSGGNYLPVSDFITFSRSSSATYFNSKGVLTTAGNDVPRYDYSMDTLIPRGLLIEKSKTNFNRNSTAAGCVPGTPGTPPNFMGFATVINGLSRSIVETGTLPNGMPYFDFRLTGIASASIISTILFLDSFIVPGAEVLSGDVQTSSCYFSLVKGSLNGITLLEWRHRHVLSDGVTNSTIYTLPILTTIDSKLKRYEVSGAATADGYVVSTLVMTTIAGTFYDFTIRMACPQREQGSFATSFIPTSTTQTTRSTDKAYIKDAYTSNAINATIGGTFLFNGEVYSPVQNLAVLISACNRTLPSFSDTVSCSTTSTGAKGFIRSGSIYSATTPSTSVNTPPINTKVAFSFASASYWSSSNGVSPTVVSSGAFPTTAQDRVYIGTAANSPEGSGVMSGHAYAATFWTTNLPSTDAPGLTS